MRYYPQSRVITGLRTEGSDFILNGVPYKGYYYITFDGKYYTGPNPIIGSNFELSPSSFNKFDVESPLSIVNEGPATKKRRPVVYNEPTFGNFTPYIPQPTDLDYKRKFIMRYFSKKFNNNYSIVEISKDQHDDFTGPNLNGYDVIMYKVTSLFWQIDGPLDTIKRPNYKTEPGIIDTNKRIIEEREREFPGIINYINEEYDKYSKYYSR